MKLIRNKLNKILTEDFFTILIIISIFLLPFVELLGLRYKRKFFYQEEVLSVLGIIIFFFILFFFMNNIKKKNHLTFKISDLFIILSILFCIISIVFSKDINASLHGQYAYSETPLQVLAYFSLFFMCTLISNDSNKKKICNSFMLLAVIEIEIAFLQNFKLWPVSSLFDKYIHDANHLAFGLTEHCNYFAQL